MSGGIVPILGQMGQCQVGGKRPAAFSFRFQQCDALGGNRIFQTDRPKVLAGLGLQADTLQLDAEDVGQALANRLTMRGQLGPLGEDDAVDVDDSQPSAATASKAARSISAESRPRFSGSVSGNICPMSPSAAAPSRASVTACKRTSASLWPTASRRAGCRCRPVATARRA